jgi:hypothetical protein
MQSTAAVLAATSRETAAHTVGAVRTSSDAFGSAEIAATAADELLKSISEINRQLVRASEVVGTAATKAESTNQEIASLAQAARKIDDVVKLIQNVAGQTNLLALNATIEAARAGAAGKGFSVVASEVKALAVQTGKATDDIAAQIAAVQASTRSAVDAIGGVAAKIQEIRQFTAAIATSVEQQNAATQEISGSVVAAAAGTKSVVAVLGRVSGAIGNMHDSPTPCWPRRKRSNAPPTRCAAASTVSSARWRADRAANLTKNCACRAVLPRPRTRTSGRALLAGAAAHYSHAKFRIRRPVMYRSRLLVLITLGVIGSGAAAQAGPCANQISQVEQAIRGAQAESGPGGAGEPSAPQSVGAQLHHQPTPGSVQSAERTAIADGDAALERARKADAQGDVAACTRALTEAKAIYGVE